ncbi:hypothetical protein CD178_02061 [Komagataeibacter saccharivorans]|uniref:Terminase small subunit protein n=1 Tax=Komagataeibacter saccharivorans TaxID=265959 RepID=A0A347WD74_9PROT|nr:hypothetical protein [Komagataeibacter saccharivorans]AXY22817.1 hypothetical protein CD178_02061 [Komagataeibacter saccharivorans]
MAPKHRLYAPDIADEILERLSDGESLASICDQKGMPSRGAVNHWVLTDHDGFASRYACAREAGLMTLADDILVISDDGRNDTYQDADGNDRVNQDVVQRSRLRVDSRKWLLSKLLPKQYGDKLNLEHSGEVAMNQMPDDQLDARLRALMAQAGGGDKS